ncbi:hypothetical protein PFISCL1PPCAC_25099, partial [Pristionchus fissidentatus]
SVQGAGHERKPSRTQLSVMISNDPESMQRSELKCEDSFSTQCTMMNIEFEEPFPSMTLETLPKENHYRILSYLGMKDRLNVRGSSKTMRKSIKESDLFVSDACLSIHTGGITLTIGHIPYLVRNMRDDWTKQRIASDGDCKVSSSASVRLRSNFNIYSNRSVRCLINFITSLFRRLCVNTLTINSHADIINSKLLQQLTAQFDFESLNLRSCYKIPLCVKNFAILSKKSINGFSAYKCVKFQPKTII